MNCKDFVATRTARTGLIAAACLAAFSLALHSGKRSPAAAGDMLMQAQLARPGKAAPLVVRGRIAAEPERRSQTTVRLRLKLNAVQHPDGSTWAPAHNVVSIDVYTMGSSGRKGDIEKDLPDMVHSTAYGDHVEASVSARRARSNHVDVRLRCHWKQVHLIERANGAWFMEMILTLKSRMRSAYESRLPDPVYRLAVGSVLGDRGPTRCGVYRNQSITTLFRRAGIGHVLAVSGLHVGIVAGGLILLLRWLRIPPRCRLVLIGVALFAYLLMTGARPATMRAVLMITVALAAHTLRGSSGTRSVWTGIVVSAAVLLVWRPRLAFDIGFQLSYGAVLSLVILTPAVLRSLERFGIAGCLGLVGLLAGTAGGVISCASLLWTPQGIAFAMLVWVCTLRVAAALDRRFLCRSRPFMCLPRPVRALIASQFAIQLGMVLPLGSLYFGSVSLAGTVVNLLAIPLIGVFVQAALLMGLLYVIPLFGHLLAWLPEKVTAATGLLFFEVAHIGTNALPCPEVPCPSPVLLLVWYAGLALILFHHRQFAAVISRASGRLHPQAWSTNTQEART